MESPHASIRRVLQESVRHMVACQIQGFGYELTDILDVELASVARYICGDDESSSSGVDWDSALVRSRMADFYGELLEVFAAMVLQCMRDGVRTYLPSLMRGVRSLMPYPESLRRVASEVHNMGLLRDLPLRDDGFFIHAHEEFRGVLLKYFLCKFCSRNISFPIYYACGQYHVFCRICYDRVNECPECREPKGVWRHLMMERLATEVVLPCLYNRFGCLTVIESAEWGMHTQMCRYRRLE